MACVCLCLANSTLILQVVVTLVDEVLWMGAHYWLNAPKLGPNAPCQVTATGNGHFLLISHYCSRVPSVPTNELL